MAEKLGQPRIVHEEGSFDEFLLSLGITEERE